MFNRYDPKPSTAVLASCYFGCCQVNFSASTTRQLKSEVALFFNLNLKLKNTKFQTLSDFRFFFTFFSTIKKETIANHLLILSIRMAKKQHSIINKSMRQRLV
jgi:hypothetical protein